MQIDLRRDQRCGFEFVGRSMLCHGRVAELITTQSPRIGASRFSHPKTMSSLVQSRNCFDDDYRRGGIATITDRRKFNRAITALNSAVYTS